MKDQHKTFHSGRAMFFLMTFIVVVVGGAVLKLTASIVLPITIALLLSFVLEPLVAFMRKRSIPRIVTILFSIAVILSCVYFLGVVLFSSGRTLLTLYPKYESRLMEIYARVAELFELPYDEQLSFFENTWGQLGIRTWVRDATLRLSNMSITFLTNALLMVIFLVFIVIEAAYFQNKIDLAFESKRVGQIKKMAAAITSQVTRYLSIKFLISLATGILVTIGLRLVGLEFPLVWGVVQFILNFIPSLGSIAIGVAATVFSLLQFWPNPAPVVMVALVMLSVNIILGNVLEPKIMGDNLGLSPIVVMASLLLWGWLWGFAGMILAVPMTVIIKIVCENIEWLEPISILMGSQKAFLAKKAEIEHDPETPPPPDSQTGAGC